MKKVCPNCFEELESDDVFCTFCGFDLSKASVGASVGYHRICKCGYDCDDPELRFCPACGIPLEEEKPVSSPVKEPPRVSSGFTERPPEKENEFAHIPEGMMTPAEDDLRIKSKYGNV